MRLLNSLNAQKAIAIDVTIATILFVHPNRNKAMGI
jgi:hypothetical protein